MCFSWACKEAGRVATVVKKKSWWVEGGGRLRSLIDAAVLIERLVVLAKRESKGVGVRHVSLGLLHGVRFANRFFFSLMHVPKERLPFVFFRKCAFRT